MPMEENKFNFNEEEKVKDQKVEASKKAVKQDAKGLLQSVKTFLNELLDFRDDTDRDATIEAIKNDISFQGATAWILICSIFVASIGLNANSTAVVIGAMLISPLMGPILGVGMSIAINDVDTLKKSLINLATMIVLSLLTAFLFFYLFPLREDTSELLGRTQPDIRDVLIAFFGGLALIIARTKRGTIASVIFGVAIATALMPPLCTAGYGLAQGNWEYFNGAMYLFTINTIFIALATFLVLKLLRFPMLRYANSKRRRMISRIATTLAIVVMIPAIWTFLSVLRQNNFERDAQNFIEKEIDALPHADFIKKNASYKYVDAENSVIELNTFGLDEIPESTIAVLQDRLNEYSSCKNTVLKVNQNKSKNLDHLRYMEQIRYRDSLDLLSQSQRIVFLENRLKKLEKLERNLIPFEEFTKEVNINYEAIKHISFSNVIASNFKKMDTLTVFTVEWDKALIAKEQIPRKQKQLEDWLKVKYNLDSMQVKSQY
ncbi:membrane protein [Mangrovimonas yunxiaonensis]|uniref:Membrane protein n=2 Tax=Mangrovimonas yunxiaonensis TaxID=1197477 RepID=A0A084TIT0_9FLAO|nr:membrane protein [Mangrovimonas yunxiaonensis]GGH46798.1 membrane protein [Mangrovimonas yunxiaonensis]